MIPLDLDSLYRPGDDWPTFQRRVVEAYDWRLHRDRDDWPDTLMSGLFDPPELDGDAPTDAAGWPLFVYDR